jgi:asparagine synthase (glutamine-hydrolysing)
VCGIAGFEIHDCDVPACSTALEKALATRGPDGSWSVVRGSLALVQTRLAVIDLSDAVVYPMENERGDIHLLYNGEIYDHEVLRRQLESRGHAFRTRCDAEVVLHGYEEWGIDVFRRLNGMFAIAIVDQQRGEVLLARDRLGIKPLVRTIGPRFAFASDAMALVEAGLSEGQVDLDALRGFATFHYVPPPQTGIQDVAVVPPGTAIRRRENGSEDHIVWAEPPFSGDAPAIPTTVEEAEAALHGAVRRQLVADVDVGVFLSGGLDSALVLSTAAALGARPQAFSIGFPGHGDYDESPAASAVARGLGVAHHVAALDTSFSDAVNRVADAYDTPFADASAIATIELARFARGHVTVALSGTGGDDLFAGYYRHRAHRLRSLVARVPRPVLETVRGAGSDPGSARQRRSRLALSYLGRLADAGAESDAEQYLALATNHTSPLGAAALRFSVNQPAVAIDVATRFHFGEPLEPTPLRAIQRFELLTYLPGDLLNKEDRATMAVGLEARVPLLDEALVDVAERTPGERTMSLREGKILLRELARRRGLSVSSLKRGFAVPLGAYFSGPWRQQAREWFGSLESDLVAGESARRLLEKKSPPANDLWMLAALAAWEQRVKEARTTSRPTRSEAELFGPSR